MVARRKVRVASGSLSPVVRALLYALLAATQVQGATNSYPLDWDGNNDGICGILVNSGGGTYLWNGAMNYEVLGSGSFAIYSASAAVSYPEYNFYSQPRTSQVRWAVVGFYPETEETESLRVTAWTSYTQNPGAHNTFVPSNPSGFAGDWGQFYCTFEAKLPSVEPPPYPSAGQGFAYIHSGNIDL